MTALRLLGKIAFVLAICINFAAADSLQLRDGRHLRGKYVGGTTAMVGFMTSGTIEYFSTSDVLALIFENNSDAPLSGLQPDPMKYRSPNRAKEAIRKTHTRQNSSPGCRLQSMLVSDSFTSSEANLETKREADPCLARPAQGNRPWTSSP